MEKKFIYLQAKDGKAENDALDRKGLDFVTPAKKPDGVDIHQQDRTGLQETKHGQDKERSNE